jgi:hypothetical protein
MSLVPDFQRLTINAVQNYRDENPGVAISEGFDQKHGWGFHIHGSTDAPVALKIKDPMGIERSIPNLDARPS